jgi:hypothetical protein
MVDMLISGRSVLADVNRQTNPLATVTIAPSEEPPTGIPGTTRTISSSQPAQLSTLGGFKSALAEFRNAATTLTALAKILNLKPLFTESVPEAANPDAPPAQTADEAGFFVATGKPAPASGQNPAIRPALLLNDSSLIDANLPQSRPQTGLPTASTSDPLATSSQSAAVLTQAIQTFVTAHNRLVTVLTQLADPGEASTPESLTGGEEALKSGQSGVARHTSPDSEHRPSLLQPFRDVGQPANRAGGVPTNAGHSSALLLTPTVLVGTPKFTSDPVTPRTSRRSIRRKWWICQSCCSRRSGQAGPAIARHSDDGDHPVAWLASGWSDIRSEWRIATGCWQATGSDGCATTNDYQAI